jgi:hypothetical protein
LDLRRFLILSFNSGFRNRPNIRMASPVLMMEVSMPREPKARFNKQTGWWSTDIAGKRHKLVSGKRGDERRKTPTQEASDALSRLLAECALNPTAEAGPAVQTVPSIIDEYLDTACRDDEERAFTEKKALLNQ